MTRIEYRTQKLYPEDSQELVQIVLSLTKLINIYLDKNDPDFESKAKSIDTIKGEILALHRNPNAKTIMINDWKTGLDLLRDTIRESREQRKKSKK